MRREPGRVALVCAEPGWELGSGRAGGPQGAPGQHGDWHTEVGPGQAGSPFSLDAWGAGLREAV